MNKVLIPVLALAAVGSATFGFIQMNAKSDLARELDNLMKKQAEQDVALNNALKDRKDALADLDAEKSRLALIQSERDQLKAKNKDLAANAEKNAGLANAAPAEKRSGPNDEDVQKFRDQIKTAMDRFNSPENRERMKTGMKDGIARSYGALFTKLGLSEENSQLVSDLLSDRNMALMDKGRKMMEDGASKESVQKDIETTKAEYDAKLKAVLGQDKFTELDTHEKTLGDQRALDSISRNMEGKNAALQPEQKDALATIMKEERMKLPASSNIMDFGGGGGGMNFLLSDTDAKAQQAQDQAYQEQVMKRASTQANLSPDQVNLLQENFNRQNQQKADARAFGGVIRPFLNGAGRGNRQ